MSEGKYIIASGPVIIENGKLLVNKDDKDDFYKIPGGTVPKGMDLEQACHDRVKAENNGKIEIISPLSPMVLWENPQTGEAMTILLIHYLAKLKNKDELKPLEPIKEITWLEIDKIKAGEFRVAPNIKFLIKKGDIR